MSVIAIIGAQWGDEGKAKFVDFFSQECDIVARYGGGANAGHTVHHNGQKYVFHLVPSGVLHEKSIGLIGNGVVLDFEYFLEEVKDLEDRGLRVLDRMYLADGLHLILPYHKTIDKAGESQLGDDKIGTTGRGIGPAYEDKMARRGLRLGDLHNPDHLKEKLAKICEYKARQLKGMFNMELEMDQDELFTKLMSFYEQVKDRIVNGSYFLQSHLEQGKTVLLEGAQATCLDIDHGTYPYVTSSSPTVGGVLTGLGVGPQWLDHIIGISKAYTTRVGSGPFPTEELSAVGDKMRKVGNEFGATTGRPRRCGWLDLEALRMAVRVNGLTEITFTKLDIFCDFESIRVCVGYQRNGQKLDCFPSHGLEDIKPVYEEMPGWKEDISGARRFSDLPRNAQRYIEKIEDEIGIPVTFISVGPDRSQSISR